MSEGQVPSGRSGDRRELVVHVDGSGTDLLTHHTPLMSPFPSRGPRYHLLAHTTLTLAAVQDGFRTHDLTLAGHGVCMCVSGALAVLRGVVGLSPFLFPILTLYFLLPQRRTLPGCPFMVACVATWQPSLSA